jgi:CRISPR-associated protein Csx17
MAEVFDVELTGCRPEPLASYLKALGVLRLVAEQKDKNAAGYWRGDHFVLRSSRDAAALVAFFENEWRPTPVVAPWNGGSGFYPNDNDTALVALQGSDDLRSAAFKQTIDVAASVIMLRGWQERPEDADKAWLLAEMRARLPDEALPWLDAAVVLGDERLLFPPLLGTGGNDGRLDFSNNYMQRVVACLQDEARAVSSALFEGSRRSKFQGAMGMYAPASSTRVNPWDFVLLIEGALLFAGAATRRLQVQHAGSLAFPFHARAGGGHDTLAAPDEGKSRDELWLPLWNHASSLREVRGLIAEGRAKVGQGDEQRSAKTSLDFARAVSQLGVERGLSGFNRFGFHERNGLAFFATPLGRYDAVEVQNARLIDEIDAWFQRLRRAAQGERVPVRIAHAARALEDSFFAVTRNLDASEALLVLGDAERALGDALAFTKKAGLQPITRRLSEGWSALVSVSVEARLGVCLGQRLGFRRRLLPIDAISPWQWSRADDPGFVFSVRPLVDNLHALLLRDDIEAQQRELQSPSNDASVTAVCRLDDIARFIDGDVDDVAIERWARAASLLSRPPYVDDRFDAIWVPATFAVLRLVHSGTLDDKTILKRPSNMLARACAGDPVGATTAALQRLSAVGRALPVAALVESSQRTRRIAAALAFPLTALQRQRLESAVLPPSHSQKESLQPSDSQMQQETA